MNLNNRYDIIFHLGPVIVPRSDGVRPSLHFNDSWRQKSDMALLSIFKMFGQHNVIEIEDQTLEDRVKKCYNYLLQLKKD
jgi:hypothetical protein